MQGRTNKNTEIFERAPIPKAVMTLALPTIITQLINIIYNLADTWYVGRTGNPAMVAALSIAMPLFVIMAAVANLFGIGGSSLISRCLGMKKPERARSVFAFCLYGGLCAAILYAAIIAVFRPQLIMLTGGDADSYQYVYDYMLWTMIIGAIPTVGNVLCGHLVRSIGAAREAGIGMSLGGVLNIILDPLFMFVILPKGNEVTGAAIATLLSNTASLIYFIIYLRRHSDNPVFTLKPADIRLDDHIPGEVFAIGFPAALSTALAMVSNIFANALVSGYGSAAVAGMGVTKKINTFAFNTTMGLTQGVLPLVGYNFGAKNYKRLLGVIKFTGAVALGFALMCMIIFRAFSGELIAAFINEAESVEYGRAFLSVFALAAPLTALTYLLNMVFQATGNRIQSLVLSVLRKGVLDIPLMFLFRALIGLTGVVWAEPVAELLSAIVAFAMLLRFLKRMGIIFGGKKYDGDKA